MKKNIKLFLIVIAILLANGCVSSQFGNDTPEWFLNPPKADDMYYGVGMAKQSNPSLSKKVAETNARVEIATNIKTEIKNLTEIYMQEAGTSENTELLQAIETATRQITDTVLVGTEVKERYISKNDTLYVLMQYPKNALAQYILQQEAVAEAYKRLPEAAQAMLEKDGFMENTFDEIFKKEE